MPRTKLMDRKLPDYSRGEELFNMISHIAGGGLSIAALVLCVVCGVVYGNSWSVASGAIYGFTLILLYTMSSLYHGLRPRKAKLVFQIIDHCSIFLLIAGTYTPITLCALRPEYPQLAWTLFGMVWGFAILGVVLNAIDLKRFEKFSMICYVGTGWTIAVAIRPLLDVISIGGTVLLFAGGLAYTVGAVLYAIGKRKRYMHSIFHLFVLLGSILHFFCVLFFVLPL